MLTTLGAAFSGTASNDAQDPDDLQDTSPTVSVVGEGAESGAHSGSGSEDRRERGSEFARITPRSAASPQYRSASLWPLLGFIGSVFCLCTRSGPSEWLPLPTSSGASVVLGRLDHLRRGMGGAPGGERFLRAGWRVCGPGAHPNALTREPRPVGEFWPETEPERLKDAGESGIELMRRTTS